MSTLEKYLLILFIEEMYGKVGPSFSGEVPTCICALEDVDLQDVRSCNIFAVFGCLDEIVSGFWLTKTSESFKYFS